MLGTVTKPAEVSRAARNKRAVLTLNNALVSLDIKLASRRKYGYELHDLQGELRDLRQSLALACNTLVTSMAVLPLVLSLHKVRSWLDAAEDHPSPNFFEGSVTLSVSGPGDADGIFHGDEIIETAWAYRELTWAIAALKPAVAAALTALDAPDAGQMRSWDVSPVDIADYIDLPIEGVMFAVAMMRLLPTDVRDQHLKSTIELLDAKLESWDGPRRTEH